MTYYEFPEHYTDSVWSAIKLAEQLKESGEFDLFRGQRHTFDICPSILRPGVDISAAEERLNNFAIWVHNTPDLSSMHKNESAILAVAQHYGLKTPFLDFSRSPHVAGFFATDGGMDGDTGTIICLNKKSFTNSWSDLNQKYLKEEGMLLTEIVNIDVRNLWRLHAQEGEFLRCHVDPSFLEMFSHFLHIYFPQKAGVKVAQTEKIYPVEKSHLEVLLDQYFLINSYNERNQRLEELFPAVISVSENPIKEEVKSYFKGKVLPNDHRSWDFSNAAEWFYEPDEHYGQNLIAVSEQLILPTNKGPDDFDAIIGEQLRWLSQSDDPKVRTNRQWSVVNNKRQNLYVNAEGITTDGDDEFTEFSIADMVNSIYAGMRYLPYSGSQIARAITCYLKMLSFDIYEMIDDCEGVEFSGARVRGRGFASRHRILSALRDDFFDLIDPTNLDAAGRMNFRDTFFAARYVRSSYQFERFIELFVEDLIPSQAVIAVEGLVIGLNPRRIDIFGES